MDQKKNFPEFYITAPQPCPYLDGRKERKLFTHLTQDKPVALVDSLLKGGFRRSQNIAYMPYCEDCSACVSVRVLVDEFKPDKSMQRVLKRNTDIAAFRNGSKPTSAGSSPGPSEAAHAATSRHVSGSKPFRASSE